MARTTRKTQAVNLDFAFFTQLWDYYNANRGNVRKHYKSLTKKFLDFNNPANGNAFLRQPQFEALEIYIFFKEFLDNAQVHEAFRGWADNTGKFEGRSVSDRAGQTQLDIIQEASKEQYDALYRQMKSSARAYSNYIFALTMGTGKTILMATCIFYEFILANKFPKDKRFCHNALVFAPDKTVLQSLREIQTFDMRRVVPPEYANFLEANIKFHFLDESGASLNTVDKSSFNLIVSNTQKIILKRQSKDKTPTDLIFGSGKQTYERGNVYDQYSDLLEGDEPDDEISLSTNQRFEKLRRLEQLGIYIDEAHHAFGDNLAKDVGAKKDLRTTSLRNTVDELAISLKQTGTRVVACYNFTGTPYVNKIVLPEVVYAFGLQEAIQKGYLKKVTVNGYSNPKTNEFIEIVIDDFIEKVQGQRYEGMLPKLAFFASTVKELQEEVRPAVEEALVKHNIPNTSILVNVGDPKLTSNDDIREFNRLDTPQSEKQFILLVNKGQEGWNCRSLFGVALFRKPKSKIFVLQATMRCLRAIGDGQHTGYVHLSNDNKDILDAELQQNFRVSLESIVDGGPKRERITAHVVEPIPKYKIKRVRRQFNLKEKNLVNGIDLKLKDAMKDTDKYRLIRTQQEGLSVAEAMQHKRTTEDLTDRRKKREFSELTLVAEIARYLNKSCLFIRNILAQTEDGTDAILEAVNEFNELLYDWVIPHLFEEFYDIEEDTTAEEYEVELVKLSADGYTLSADTDLIVGMKEAGDLASKSFHLDKYAFDSNPEKTLFWNLLSSGRVKKLYFTGMLTHGQTEFFIQYIDPDSHSIRSYYPDFVVEKEDQSLVIVEVKGDNKIDDPLVQAKKEAAEKFAYENDMTYRIIKGSEASQGIYQTLLD